VCGYDHKQDFNAARLKTAALNYCDLLGKGRIGAVSISNTETEVSHTLSWQIIFANLPCDSDSCSHPQQLYIFDDNNCFFQIRPWALKNNNCFPKMQHDKVDHFLNAAGHQNLGSTLCNFHGL
jgi:hypothetical protein